MSAALPFMQEILDTVKPKRMPMSVFIDALILELPDLIEDRFVLAHDVDSPEAQKRLENKRREFSSVLCQVEHLRHVIRQYYRNTSI